MEENTPKKEDKQAEKVKAPKKERKLLRFILSFLFIGLVVIQLFQPDKNNNSVSLRNDISTILPVPDTVNKLLALACYDCHSNNTNYPWYTNIQPISWWLQNHIEEGKQHFNFNEFATIQAKNGKTALQRQLHKLEEIKETLEEGEMPLPSYLWMHKEADLSKEQKQMIINWADSSGKSLALRSVN